MVKDPLTCYCEKEKRKKYGGWLLHDSWHFPSRQCTQNWEEKNPDYCVTWVVKQRHVLGPSCGAQNRAEGVAFRTVGDCKKPWFTSPGGWGWHAQLGIRSDRILHSHPCLSSPTHSGLTVFFSQLYFIVFGSRRTSHCCALLFLNSKTNRKKVPIRARETCPPLAFAGRGWSPFVLLIDFWCKQMWSALWWVWARGVWACHSGCWRYTLLACCCLESHFFFFWKV